MDKETQLNEIFEKLPLHYQELVIEYMEFLLEKAKRTSETICNPEK
ncbi:hypothetical protein MK805_01055 [Shimazuella sp. AN120528]|nr:hypothetical protein [Shimazuella soli]MCH5583559.1 hypothetical protein [Shimazuella soli]